MPIERGIGTVGSLALLLVCAALGQTSAQRRSGENEARALEKQPHAIVGALAPRFFLPTIDDRDFYLRDWAGPDREIRNRWRHRPKHVVVLSFFATWCVPCRDELPELQALSREYEGQNVLWRLVNVGDDLESIRTYLRRLSVSIPVLHDRYSKVAPWYAGEPVRLPTLVVIDRDGVVRLLHHGYDPDTVRRVAAVVSESLGIAVPSGWELAHPTDAESLQQGAPATDDTPDRPSE